MVREDDIEQIITSMLLDLKLETVVDRSDTSDQEGTIYKAGNWSYGGAFPSSTTDQVAAGSQQVAYLETPCSYC